MFDFMNPQKHARGHHRHATILGTIGDQPLDSVQQPINFLAADADTYILQTTF